MFLNGNADRLDHCAVADESGNRLTYRDLENLSEGYAELVLPRSLIAILCDHDIDTVAFYYSMMNNGAVPFLLSNTLNRELAENLIRTYRPEYIWAETGAGILQEGWREVCRKGSHVLIKTGYGKAELYRELALLLPTSGSTGSSKFVRQSRANLICGAEIMADYVGLQEDDRGISAIPYSYCYGLTAMHMHWYMGAAFYITPRLMVEQEFWDFFEESRITNFSVLPYQYQILEKVGFVDRSYPFFRFSVAGGAAFGDRAWREAAEGWKEKGIRFYVIYGQTEGVGMLTGVPADRALDKVGSIGVPGKGLKAYIDGPEQGEGELVLEGMSIGLGYALDRADLKKEDENGGVLHTGDIASMDDEGYIFLKGRRNRFIKLLGMRISLDEVEGKLRREYRDGELACVGNDERLTVYYTGACNSETIRKYCMEKFSIKKTMISVKTVESIPRNESGKIHYAALGAES